MNLNIDMTDSFSCRLRSITVYTITRGLVDGDRVETETSEVLKVAIQMAEPEDLKVEQVDWSKQYIWAFSKAELKMNQEVEWDSTRFRIIKVYNAKLYGYYKAVCEEVKEP